MADLKENDAQLRAMTNALAEGLLVFDQEGVLQYLNPEAQRLLGWNPPDVIKIRTHEFLHHPAQPHNEKSCFIERALQTQTVVKSEGEKIYRQDGTAFLALAVASPIAEDGEVVGCAVALLDITESMQLREALQTSLVRIQKQREFYRKIYDGVLDGVVLQDGNGKIIHVNPATEGLLGLPFSELVLNTPGEATAAFMDEEGHSFVWRDYALEILNHPAGQLGMHKTLHRFQPRPRWLSLHSLVLLQGERNSVIVLTTLRDITQFKYAEQQEGILYKIAQRILTEQPLPKICQNLCDELVLTMGFPVAIIGLKEADGSVRLIAQSGLTDNQFSTIKIRWDDTPEGRGAFGEAMHDGEAKIHHLSGNPRFKPWWDMQEKLGLRSLAALPLRTHGETLGVLAVYSHLEDHFDTSEIIRLQSLANQVALAHWTYEDRLQLRIQNAALMASANAIVITDRTGQIHWANPAFTRLTGYPLESVVDKNPRFLGSGFQDAPFYERMWKTILADQTWHGELVNRRANGTLYSEEMTITPVKVENQEITHFIAMKQDISERLAIQKALRVSEEHYREMFETMSSAVAVFRIADDGRNFICTEFNRVAEHLEKLSTKEVVGLPVTEIFPSTKELDFLQLMFRVFRTGERVRFPAFFYENKRTNGWREGLIYRLSMGDLVLLYDDVTQRILDEMTLWQEKERAQVTLASIGDAVLTTDVLGRVTYLNPVAETLIGWTQEEARGLAIERVFDVRYELNGQALEQPVRQCLREQRIIALANHAVLRHRDGRQTFTIEDSAAPIRDRDQHVIGAVLVFHDVSEKHALLNRLSHQAHHDALTDLPNRLLFKDRAHQAILRARRRHEQVAVFFLDLDDFKLVNDTLGHTVGDSLLRLVGERLGKRLRQEDTVARQGGDEFLILLPELFTAQQAAEVAQNILDILTTPFQLHEQEIYITASLGIALYPTDGEDIETLIQHADAAMYQAKREKCNHYQFYTVSLNQSLTERLAMQNEMRKGLEQQEFILYYQPLYHLRDGRLCGLEALVRWQHPKKGLLLPEKFISIAEDSGLILPLGEWILRSACAQNKYWQEMGYPPIRVAVNLSARQFRQKNLVNQIANIISETGLEPGWLELEITESLSMENVDLTIDTLQELKAMGIRLSIDDFGTGFSSLSYLSRFPLDTLKIDRSFVAALNSRLDGQAIVITIIQLAQNLGLKVIAEGVESQSQLDFLREKGCDEVQGFLLAEPVSVEELTPYFTESGA